MVLDKRRPRQSSKVSAQCNIQQANKPELRKAKIHNPSYSSEKRENTTQVLQYHTTIARESPINHINRSKVNTVANTGANLTKPKRKQTSKIIRYFKQHHSKGMAHQQNHSQKQCPKPKCYKHGISSRILVVSVRRDHE